MGQPDASMDEAIRRAERLLDLPNVTGVGTGERDGKPIIKVFVERKVPEDQLAPDDIVPRVIGGYPTDVEVGGRFEAQPRDIQEREEGRR
jgi:hypothetical protein